MGLLDSELAPMLGGLLSSGWNRFRGASSRMLREAGIPGIKYLDQGSRLNVGHNAKRLVSVNGKPITQFSPNTGDALVDYQLNNLMTQLENGKSVSDVLKIAEKSAAPATVSEFRKLQIRTGEQTYNYVVFPGEEKALKILERK